MGSLERLTAGRAGQVAAQVDGLPKSLRDGRHPDDALSAENEGRTRLRKQTYEAVVVGTGFAGAVAAMANTSFGRVVTAKRDRPDDAIRELLATAQPPPMGWNIATGEIAVWVSGHTHAPALSEFVRPDGRMTVIANPGCWLLQLQPVSAWLGAPTVFVPAFVHTHVRVRLGQGSLTVELWNHPKPAGRRIRWIDPLRIVPKRPKRGDRRLQWIKRVAIIGRMPSQPPAGAAPRLVSRHEVPR